MKTSNKILLAATLIIITYLIIYDFALQAEYRKGDFKSSYYHMQQLKFNNFTTIEHNAGNIIGLKVQKGPYAVWINEYLKDKVTISQHNQTLQIDYTGKKGDYVNGYETAIIISCPNVASITTNPYIAAGGSLEGRSVHKSGESIIVQRNPHGISTVSGFSESSMNIQASQFTEIDLENNSLDELNAKIGANPTGDAGLTVNANNKIKAANLQVLGKSSLRLDDLVIDKINYNLADNAEVTLTGKASGMLNKK